MGWISQHCELSGYDWIELTSYRHYGNLQYARAYLGIKKLGDTTHYAFVINTPDTAYYVLAHSPRELAVKTFDMLLNMFRDVKDERKDVGVALEIYREFINYLFSKRIVKSYFD